MSVEEAERKGSARNRTSVSQLGSRDPARSQKLSVVAPRPFDKQAVLVLGMHRSGTSAVTRFLNRLGAHLPSKLIPPDADSNVHGFWEPRNIVDIHDELLASAGSSWDDVAAFPRSWFDSELAQSFQDRVPAQPVNATPALSALAGMSGRREGLVPYPSSKAPTAAA